MICFHLHLSIIMLVSRTWIISPRSETMIAFHNSIAFKCGNYTCSVFLVSRFQLHLSPVMLVSRLFCPIHCYVILPFCLRSSSPSSLYFLFLFFSHHFLHRFMTCSYHLSLASCVLFFTVTLIVALVILSSLVTPHNIHHNILISPTLLSSSCRLFSSHVLPLPPTSKQY